MGNHTRFQAVARHTDSLGGSPLGSGRPGLDLGLLYPALILHRWRRRMNILKLFKGTAEEVRLNPNIGTFSWFLHRISGVLLLIYLFIHLWVLGSAQSGTAAFDARLRMVQSPLFHFLEIGLVFVIFYHMINGLSITVMDFFNLSAS